MASIRIFWFFFKQKTAYERRISDWSSDVCSSDLLQSVGWVERSETHQKLSTERCPITRHASKPAAGQASKPSVHRPAAGEALFKIGRASCRERVCQYV